MTKKVWLFFCLILLVSSFVRFYGLGKQSFWCDEYLTWRLCNKANLSSVLNGLRYDVQNPLYPSVQYFVQKYSGDSEIKLRFPSAVFGVFAVASIFLLGLRLYSYREAVIASGLCAVSFAPIYFSQEARPYSMLFFLSTLSVYFLIPILRGIRENGKVRLLNAAVYVVIAVLLSHTHYFGIYFIFLQAIASLIFIKLQIKKQIGVTLIYVLIAAAFVPWLPFLIYQYKHDGHLYSFLWIGSNSMSGFVDFLMFIFRSKYIAYFVCGGFIYLTFLNASRCVSEGCGYILDMLNPDFMLFLWLVVPFALMYIKSMVSTPLLVSRYYVISFAPVFLLFARAVTQLKARDKYKFGFAALVICLSACTIYAEYYSKPLKTQAREAVQYIAVNEPDMKNTVIVCSSHPDIKGVTYYLFRLNNKDIKFFVGVSIDQVISRINYLGPSHIWLMTATGEGDASVEAKVFSCLKCLQTVRFYGINARLYKNDANALKNVKI